MTPENVLTWALIAMPVVTLIGFAGISRAHRNSEEDE